MRKKIMPVIQAKVGNLGEGWTMVLPDQKIIRTSPVQYVSEDRYLGVVLIETCHTLYVCHVQGLQREVA